MDRHSKYIYANKDFRAFYKQKGFDNIIGNTNIDIDENGDKQYKEVVKIPLSNSYRKVSGL